MADDVEQIEAKLCAFVDGLLGPADHAEIEQHLAANPSHTALVQDLMAQRQMLRRLPRESAPPDLTEILQSQLEREALLAANMFEESPPFLRIRRWPQLLAAAAIVALALGLGTIVYLVLPPAHPVASIVAPPPDNPVVDARTRTPTDESIVGNLDKEIDTKAGREADAPGDLQDRTYLIRNQKGGADGAVALNSAAFFGLADTNEGLVIMVKAADIQLANDEVVKYLEANSIPWTPADTHTVARALSEQPQEPQAPQGGAVYGAVQPAPTTAPAQQVETLAKAGNADPKAASALSKSPAAPAPDQFAAASDPGGQGGTIARQPDGLPQPLRGVVRSQVSRQLFLTRDDSAAARTGRVILVRNLNGQQLSDLTTTLSLTQRSRATEQGDNEDLLIARLQPPARPAVAKEYLREQSNEQARLGGAYGAKAFAPAPPSIQLTSRPSLLDQGQLAQQMLSKPADVGLFPTTAPATMPGATTMPVAIQGEGTQWWRMADMTTTSQGLYNCVIVLEDGQSPQVAPTTRPASEASQAPVDQAK